MLDPIIMDTAILNALKEDMPFGDITTDSIIEPGALSRAILIAKQDAVIAGLEVFERVFKLLDQSGSLKFNRKIKDGDTVKKGDIFLEFEGPTTILLKGERTALNFLQHMSGIATKTREFSDLISDLPAQVVDTRKTIPGMRVFAKYAVKVGGGHSHRHCLSDGVLIKDNHIAAAGGIKKAVELARKNIPHTVKIEVETENLKQVEEALEAGADIIMLDNMSCEMMKEAVALINKRAVVEASGNVNINTIRQIAETGVDIISIGALTHSVKAVDISMKFLE